jgi:hypothetical protein
MPKESEERRLIHSKAYRELDEGKKKVLFYATLALEEAFGVYKSVLRKYAEGLREAVEKREVGEGPFKRVMYVADVGRLAWLAEEESKAFEDALKILRERLNEYTVRYGLRDLLDVKEGVARRLAEAEKAELSELNDVNFGVKALAALMAYREYALGRKSLYGAAAKHWLEVGGSAWLLYYAPKTAYDRAEKARAEKPATVEELAAEALRRLFLKPGADQYHSLVEELTKVGELALELENKTESSYVFKLYRLEEGGLKELGVKLRITKVGEEESIVYALELDARWREFFKQELEVAAKAAEEVGGHLLVEDLLLYMLGWVNSDVAITRNKNARMLEMGTSHLWQLAETHALFGWSDVEVLRVGLTLEGPKPQFQVRTSLEKLDETIKRSAEGGWLKMLGIKAESWDGLKRWVAENWDVVVDAAVKRLGEGVRSELEALKNMLHEDKIAREVVAPTLLLIQAERLGVNEETLRYFGAVVSGAIGGDGSVSAARKKVDLTSGKREVALLWAAALAAHGIKAVVEEFGGAPRVVASGDDAVKLARLYFLYGPPLLEGDDRLKNHKLAEAVELGAEGLSVSWDGLRRTPSERILADLTISEGNLAINYNVCLCDTIELIFQSTDRNRAELAARLLRLAGVNVKMKKVGKRGAWQVYAYTDMLAAGRRELREAIADIVRRAVEKGWVDEKRAEHWLKKLERGRTVREGWPKYMVKLNNSTTLVIKHRSTNLNSIMQEAQRLREMGLEEGEHFTVKMSKGGRYGYVYIRREGLAYAAWLSVHGSGEQQRLAVAFVEHILQRAEEAGDDMRKKAEEIVKEGKERGSLELKGFEREVEVDGEKYKVKVIGGEAVEEDRGGRKLLRIRITAEVGRVEGEHIVDRVVHEYTITYSRRGKLNAIMCFAVARADAPGGREADAERLAAVIKALTGKEPRIRRTKSGEVIVEGYREHLDGFMQYAELANSIIKWLRESKQ